MSEETHDTCLLFLKEISIPTNIIVFIDGVAPHYFSVEASCIFDLVRKASPKKGKHRYTCRGTGHVLKLYAIIFQHYMDPYVFYAYLLFVQYKMRFVSYFYNLRLNSYTLPNEV